MNLTEIAKRYMELKTDLKSVEDEMKALRDKAHEITGGAVVDVQLSETKNARIRRKERNGHSVKDVQIFLADFPDVFNRHVNCWTAEYTEIREVRR